MKQTLFFLLISFSLSAQIKGVVKDSISGKPIEYVGIFTSLSENNFSSDKKGKFKIENLTAKDTLWFFTTGYKEKKVAFKDLSKEVYLEPIVQTNKEINNNLVDNKQLWIDYQKNDKSHSASSSSSSSLKAYFIEGINNQKNQIYLDSISLSTLNFSETSNVFKIRFFKSDTINNIGEEYNIKPLIVKVKASERYGTNNVIKNFLLKHDIKILDRKIMVPQEGFFIAIETLNLKQNRSKIGSFASQELSISPSIKTTITETKVYSYTKGKWKKVEKANYFPDFKISIATTKN